MGLFKNNAKNQPAPVVDNTHDKLDAARTYGNQIYNILDDIDFDALANRPDIISAEVKEPNGEQTIAKNGVEIVNDIRSKVEYLKKLLKTEISAELVKISSERLDKQILIFAENLKDSLKSGNLVTAMACILGLGYGIQKGHKPLPASMTDDYSIERELLNREKKIRFYESIVKLCVINDGHRKKLTALTNQYVETKQDFEQVHEEFIKQKKVRPDIYKAISGFTGKEAADMSPEYFQAWQLAAKHNNLYERGRLLNTQRAYVEQSININDQEILSLRNAALMSDYEIDPELNMQIREQLKSMIRRWKTYSPRYLQIRRLWKDITLNLRRSLILRRSKRRYTVL